MLEPTTSRRAALRHLTEALQAAGIDNAAGEARFLLLDLLALEPFDLVGGGEKAVGEAGADRLARALDRRRAGEPVARILGAWEFWGLPFRLSPETLVPRPDTETLVEAALRLLPDKAAPARILDLGTGSGCILVALLSERPAAFGLGIDRSEGALRTARENARRNGVGDRAAFLAGDWCDGLSGPPFDLVVSNPPYIASGVIPALAREVREHDPAAALDGGADGLDAYRRILAGLGPHLAPGAPVLFEIGFDQAGDLRRLGPEAGFALHEVVRDLAGHERVTILAQDVSERGPAVHSQGTGKNAC
ncbi:peptide chain release factor N(5)-glutamine methyltransferase [Methylobacterium dankookense]|uniref:Release factor glutamine methyltransferase n=1 Tax=Methylobacterium dankookense TaxID=560405 RepID=A0A564FUR5_9HYPH|nr:peptide chain release factor N(5)-glutamine methyltransferase [Methylobacterium dankookense]GJD56696.1 Release factor glutamine methyltransferase [Methylobacterium dankookense]VUF11171.1 Release factor glutamine methyltransferase [Methylobacterium dankookense]